MKDGSGQKLAYVYYEEEAGRRSTAKLLTCDWCNSGRPHLCPSRELLSVPPRPGAFAELVRVPERNLYLVPNKLGPAKAALTEPLAVA